MEFVPFNIYTTCIGKADRIAQQSLTFTLRCVPQNLPFERIPYRICRVIDRTGFFSLGYSSGRFIISAVQVVLRSVGGEGFLSKPFWAFY